MAIRNLLEMLTIIVEPTFQSTSPGFASRVYPKHTYPELLGRLGPQPVLGLARAAPHLRNGVAMRDLRLGSALYKGEGRKPEKMRVRIWSQRRHVRKRGDMCFGGD